MVGKKESGEPEWRRRRRLNDVFGETIPEQIADPGDTAHTPRDRDWYERNRPPHHE